MGHYHHNYNNYSKQNNPNPATQLVNPVVTTEEPVVQPTVTTEEPVVQPTVTTEEPVTNTEEPVVTTVVEEPKPARLGTVCCKLLNIRRAPVVNQYNVIAVAYKDDVVEIIGEEGEFFRVNVRNTNGYVMKKFIVEK